MTQPDGEIDQVQYWRRALREYIAMVRPYKGRMLRIVFWVLIIQTLAIVEPSIIMSIINDVSRHGAASVKTLPMLGAFAGAALLALTVLKVKQFAGARNVEADLEVDLPVSCLRKLLELPMSYHQTENTGRVVGKIVRGVGRIVDLTWNVTFEFVPMVIMTLVTLVILAVVNPWYALITFATCIAWVVILVRARNSQRHHYLRRHKLFEEADEHLGEAVTNMLTVQSCAQEDRMLERNEAIRREVRSVIDVEFRQYDLFAMVRGNVVNTARVGIMLATAYGAARGGYSVGQVVFLAMLVERFFNNLHHLAGVYDRFVECLDPLHRVTELLATPNTVPEPTNPVALPETVSGRIELRDITYTYKKLEDGAVDTARKPTLRGLSFVAEPGRTIGIAGPSGVGKSTFVSMVLRADDPDAGAVLLDGIDLRNIAKKDLRARIGYVPQNVQIFDTSVTDNIRFGKPSATDEEVEEAARIAGAHDFIMALPDGYKTRVGTNGITLSGGQRQRLGIARAVLAKPEVLIFDEATSSIDPVSIKKIMAALKFLRGKCTILLVSHQFATLVELADEIIVLNEGVVAEQGTHADLMRGNGLYRSLASVQMHVADMAQA